MPGQSFLQVLQEGVDLEQDEHACKEMEQEGGEAQMMRCFRKQCRTASPTDLRRPCARWS